MNATAKAAGTAARQDDLRFSRIVFWLTFITGLAGLVVFYAFPQLDLAVSAWFFRDGAFLFKSSDTWSLIRKLLMWGFTGFYVLVVVGCIGSLAKKTDVWGLSPVKWLYLVACSLAGPLLLANLILKTHIGRARPQAVTEFGGSLDFSPVYELAGKCPDNCSFVSGEVSSMVMIFAAMMFVMAGRWRWLLAILLLPAWALAGVMRIGQGAHFFSDAFFAGIFMILIAAFLHRKMVLNRTLASLLRLDLSSLTMKQKWQLTKQYFAHSAKTRRKRKAR
jgi:lipid A 4'-phosphatase